MTDDLVARLLAAIQEHEDVANDSKVARNADEWVVAHRPPPAWGDPTPDPVVLAGGKPVARFDEEYGGSFHADHVMLNDPASVLRMCQAHREIVLAYEGAELQQRKRPDDEVNNGYVLGISRAVAELAEGYGIEATP